MERAAYTEAQKLTHTEQLTYSLFANCNKLLVPKDLWNLAKSNRSELLTILLHQHLSADHLWALLLCQHVSADDPWKSSWNLFLKILAKSVLWGLCEICPERYPSSGGRYSTRACCNPGDLYGSHSGLVFIGSQDDCLWSINFPLLGHNSCQVILGPPRADCGPGISGALGERLSVPTHCTVTKTRTKCWLVLRAQCGPGVCTTMGGQHQAPPSLRVQTDQPLHDRIWSPVMETHPLSN